MDTQIIEIPITQLEFDRKNPRLFEFGLTSKSSEEEVVKVLWEAMDVRELILSIASSGFFRHEPLIVTIEENKKVVIEGNRRLAAVKLLVDPSLRERTSIKEQFPEISVDTLLALPCIEVGSREEAWRFLGFKHVNGPAKWGSYAKSKYIADVHRNFGVPLDDIASQIGDTHKTVRRLFRGLVVVEQAEKMKVFDLDDRYKTQFAFSHLYTGLGYDGVSTFLSLNPDEDSLELVPETKMKELGELCLWLYGSRKKNIRPVILSQNPDLRYLDAALKSREALAALRSGASVVEAYEISRPTDTVFEESLLSAKRNLQKAKALVSEGYDNSEDLLKVAASIHNLALALYQEMQRKRQPAQEERLPE